MQVPTHLSTLGLLCMREHVRLQICRLGKTFVAVVKWADIRTIAGVDTDVHAEVKVKGESLTTTLKGTLQEKGDTETIITQMMCFFSR